MIVSFDYAITAINKFTDGDTIRGGTERVVEYSDDLIAVLRSRGTNGWPLRFIIVGTPERKDDPVGWQLAKDQTTGWILDHWTGPGSLRVQTYGKDNLSRYLADIYVAEDRGDTITQFLMRDCGWPRWEPK